MAYAALMQTGSKIAERTDQLSALGKFADFLINRVLLGSCLTMRHSAPSSRSQRLARWGHVKLDGFPPYVLARSYGWAG
jgi:hypothetical protein